jgi:hypothetical protein
MTALFTRLSNALVPGTFRYIARRMVMWEELIQGIVPAPFLQPALILFDGAGLGGGKTLFEQRGRGRPPVRIIDRTIVVYAQLPGGGTPAGPDATTPPGSVFGPLSEAIEGALTPDPGEPTITLGGLVSHVWIEGEGFWSTGDFDPNGQGMMTVPVRIMIP